MAAGNRLALRSKRCIYLFFGIIIGENVPRENKKLFFFLMDHYKLWVLVFYKMYLFLIILRRNAITLLDMYISIFVVKIVFENVNLIKYSVNVLPVHTAMMVVFFVDIPILLPQLLSKKAMGENRNVRRKIWNARNDQELDNYADRYVSCILVESFVKIVIVLRELMSVMACASKTGLHGFQGERRT